MYKGIKFDVELPKIRGTKWKYAMEHEAIHEFVSSEYKNMLFEYDNEREAKTACVWLNKNIKAERMPLEAHTAKANVVILKVKREAK